MALFNDLKFYVVEHSLDPRTYSEIKDTIKAQGGRLATYLTDNLDIVVANQADIREVNEAKVYDIPVVTHRWIFECVRCENRLPYPHFSPECSSLFLGLVFCPTQISPHDAGALSAMITMNGGECEKVYSGHTTHVISSSTTTEKYLVASQQRQGVKLVTPDWVTDCIRSGRLLDERHYHPALLYREASSPGTAAFRTSSPLFHQPSPASRPVSVGSTGVPAQAPYAYAGPPTPSLPPSSGGFTQPYVQQRTVPEDEAQAEIQNMVERFKFEAQQIQSGSVAKAAIGQESQPLSPLVPLDPSRFSVQVQVERPHASSISQAVGGAHQPRTPGGVVPPAVAMLSGADGASVKPGTPTSSQSMRSTPQPHTPSSSPVPISGAQQQFYMPEPNFAPGQYQGYMPQPGGHRMQAPEHVQYPQHRPVYRPDMPPPQQLPVHHSPYQATPAAPYPAQFRHLAQQGQSQPSPQSPHSPRAGQFSTAQSPHQQYSTPAGMVPPSGAQMTPRGMMQPPPQSAQMAKQPRWPAQGAQQIALPQTSAPPRMPPTPMSPLQPRMPGTAQQAMPIQYFTQAEQYNVQQQHGNYVQTQQNMVPQQLTQQQLMQQRYPMQAPDLYQQQQMTPTLQQQIPLSPQMQQQPHGQQRFVYRPPQYMQTAPQATPPQQATYQPALQPPQTRPMQQQQPQQQPDARRYQFVGHDVQVPSDLCLLACVFLIFDYDRLLDQKEVADWRLTIQQCGGEVENAYSQRVTHVICESVRHPVVQQALKDGKRCVGAQWLNDCILQRRMLPPWRAIHFPSSFGENRPCKDRIFTLTGFDLNERACLRQMIAGVGGRYTTYLCKKNFAVMAKRLEGEKVVKAMEWGIPVVNVQWLTDVLLGHQGAIQNIKIPKYQQFLPPLEQMPQHSSQMQPDLFQIDSALLPTLMNAWRQPVSVSSDAWKLAVERKHRVENDDGKIFPFKKLKLSPAPDAMEIEQNNLATAVPAGVNPVVLLTGFYPLEVENLSKKLLYLGGELANTPLECTHIVAPDVKRTLKVLKGIALGKPVVYATWIRQSFKQNMFLNYNDYLVKDEGNERFFGFNLRLSLKRAQKRRLFENMMFYLTPGVPPSLNVVKEVIEAAGGSVLQQRPPSRKLAELQAKGVNIAIISCENDLHLCENLLRRNVGVHSAEFVLTGVLRQEIDYELYRLELKSTLQPPHK